MSPIHANFRGFYTGVLDHPSIHADFTGLCIQCPQERGAMLSSQRSSGLIPETKNPILSPRVWESLIILSKYTPDMPIKAGCTKPHGTAALTGIQCLSWKSCQLLPFVCLKKALILTILQSEVLQFTRGPKTEEEAHKYLCVNLGFRTAPVYAEISKTANKSCRKHNRVAAVVLLSKTIWSRQIWLKSLCSD